MKYKGLIPTLAQHTIQSCKTCQDGEPVHQSTKSTHCDIDRIIQHLLDSADTVVIYAGDYECRIVRTKRVQLAAVKQNVSC